MIASWVTVCMEVIMAGHRVSRARRWTAEQARAVLDEVDRRGMSVNQFAAEKGLVVERLYRWRRLLGRRKGPAAPVARFAEVLVRPDARAGVIEIELPGGVGVRVAGESRVDDAVGVLTRLRAR
jgi:transposase-like protein